MQGPASPLTPMTTPDIPIYKRTLLLNRFEDDSENLSAQGGSIGQSKVHSEYKGRCISVKSNKKADYYEGFAIFASEVVLGAPVSRENSSLWSSNRPCSPLWGREDRFLS